MGTILCIMTHKLKELLPEIALRNSVGKVKKMRSEPITFKIANSDTTAYIAR